MVMSLEQEEQTPDLPPAAAGQLVDLLVEMLLHVVTEEEQEDQEVDRDPGS